jgi:iron complex outermembrane recepter protein
LNLIEVILAQGSLFQCTAVCGALDPPTCHRPLEPTMARFVRHSRLLLISPIAVVAWLATAGSWAQSPSTQLAPVTVSGRAYPTVGVGGWGDVPLSRAPLQGSVFSAEQLKDNGVQRLSELTGFDPALSDAYNTEGYWDYLTVRGFVLDNRFNFRRDGLPISAETSIPLDNKARIEILKGASGIQAGTSAPGGLVNYVVKRPTNEAVTSASLEWRQSASLAAAIDLSRRFGADQGFGLRVNAAAASLDPRVRSAQGKRHMLALAGDWRLSPDTLLEAEFETSQRSQPSVPGFSMLGNTVPAAGDARVNLNSQPWSLPVVFDGNTASLRLQQRLSADWRFTAHLASQRLKTDDRIAFPFGCFSPDPAPGGTYYADRYCPDGSFDLYDFRSENERRRSDALDLSFQGKRTTGTLRHDVTVGLLNSKVKNRFQRQAFNFAGTGNVQGTAVTPAAPDLTDENTNRDERSTEAYARDAIAITEDLTAWLGLRHTRLQRESVRTDGSRATDYRQSFSTPWLAVSYAFATDQLVYASWGQGIESEVAPGRARYTNNGEALPALKSRQIEIGLKGSTDVLEWGLAGFDIQRPQFADFGTCGLDSTCTRQADGSARHRGIEASGAVRSGPWVLRGGAQWLHARREDSQVAAINGLEPTNVPAQTLKLQAIYSVAQFAGLSVQGGLTHENRRRVLPDNSASIPGWSRIDLAANYRGKFEATTVTWRAGIDNLFDTRAWRESPYQFGHAYLFPLAPRTLRASMQIDL